MYNMEETDFNYFDNRSYPPDLVIATYGLLNEHIGIINCFTDKKSNEITFEMMVQADLNVKDLVFMTNTAFLFFLPSFMKIIGNSRLQDENEIIDVVVSSFLIKLGQSETLRNEINLLGTYTKKHCHVIAKFLTWLDKNYYSIYQSNGINYASEALNLYWDRFLDLNLYEVLFEPINFSNKSDIKSKLAHYFDENKYPKNEFKIKDITDFNILKNNILCVFLLNSTQLNRDMNYIIQQFFTPCEMTENDFLAFVDGFNQYQLIIIAKFLLHCKKTHHSFEASEALDSFWMSYLGWKNYQPVTVS